jgi:hypothetical protein
LTKRGLIGIVVNTGQGGICSVRAGRISDRDHRQSTCQRRPGRYPGVLWTALEGLQQNIQQAFTKLFTESAGDPQTVADAALRLVDTEKGKRPLRTPLDPFAGGIDVEYNRASEEIKKRWMGAYGL